MTLNDLERVTTADKRYAVAELLVSNDIGDNLRGSGERIRWREAPLPKAIIWSILRDIWQTERDRMQVSIIH